MTDPCPICHEEASLTNAANRAFLPCGHWFHPACIQEWWARILRPECPLCRHTPATAALPVRLVWWNVANAAEENDPDRGRLRAVCDAIIEHNPTVISLLVCAGEGGVGRLTPASVLTFIAQRTGLTVADLRPLVLDSLSLGETSWQGVLYDAQRVCCTGRRDAEWVVAPTGARGVLVVFCEFQQRPADGQQRRFRVASTHLSHEPVEAARSLAKWAWHQQQPRSVPTAPPVPCFLGGDFTTTVERRRVMDALCTAPAGTGGGMVWTPVSTPTSTYAVALGVPGWTEAAPSRAVRHARTGDHHVLEINAQIDH